MTDTNERDRANAMAVAEAIRSVANEREIPMAIVVAGCLNVIMAITHWVYNQTPAEERAGAIEAIQAVLQEAHDQVGALLTKEETPPQRVQ